MAFDFNIRVTETSSPSDPRPWRAPSKRVLCLIGLTFLVETPLPAQPVFRGSEIFSAEEFAARRAQVLAQIGDGVAIVLGTTEPPGEMPFRQNSQFFHLTGVAEPRASVIIDGRTKKTTVFLAAEDGEAGQIAGTVLAWGAERRRPRRSASMPRRPARISRPR